MLALRNQSREPFVVPVSLIQNLSVQRDVRPEDQPRELCQDYQQNHNHFTLRLHGDTLAQRRCSVTRRQTRSACNRGAIGAFTGAAWFSDIGVMVTLTIARRLLRCTSRESPATAANAPKRGFR